MAIYLVWKKDHNLIKGSNLRIGLAPMVWSGYVSIHYVLVYSNFFFKLVIKSHPVLTKNWLPSKKEYKTCLFVFVWKKKGLFKIKPRNDLFFYMNFIFKFIIWFWLIVNDLISVCIHYFSFMLFHLDSNTPTQKYTFLIVKLIFTFSISIFYLMCL